MLNERYLDPHMVAGLATVRNPCGEDHPSKDHAFLRPVGPGMLVHDSLHWCSCGKVYAMRDGKACQIFDFATQSPLISQEI